MLERTRNFHEDDIHSAPMLATLISDLIPDYRTFLCSRSINAKYKKGMLNHRSHINDQLEIPSIPGPIRTEIYPAQTPK